MAKKPKTEPNVINITREGSIIENVRGKVIPYTSKTEEFYKLVYSFITGIKYADINAPPPKE